MLSTFESHPVVRPRICQHLPLIGFRNNPDEYWPQDNPQGLMGETILKLAQRTSY